MRLRTGLVAVATLLSCLATGIPAVADDSGRGAALFEFCGTCHGADGSGNAMYQAPAIAGMAEWHVRSQLYKFRDGKRGTHFDDQSGMRMRPMAMWLRSDEDLEAVAKHVASLPKVDPEPLLVGGDPERGKQLYAPCISCHGHEGQGNPDTQGSPLANVSDWYLLEQLKKFKAGIRGSNPADPYATMMRPMAMGLPDEQAMKDILAYISTLSQ